MLPNVAPNSPVTVFYRLTVCDSSPAVEADLNTAANCTNGRTGSALVRIVVHDASSAPEVTFSPTGGAVLTVASTARGDAAPQATVGQFTGVENQFIVAAGSTVRLAATVEDDDQNGGHTIRWTGATPVGANSTTATVRVPADAADGDTIDGSVTVTDNTRLSTTAAFQLLVGQNTPPTAGGVPTNGTGITGVIDRSSYTDGIQSQKDGATVTLRGVGNDADGDALIHAWVLRETPDDFGALMTTALTVIGGITETQGTPAYRTAFGAAIAPLGLGDLEEPDEPLFELSGALSDTVSFDVPNLENGETKGTILIFTVIDSKGVAASQLIYIEVTGDDDVPNADAGVDQQVEPGSFVRLNGSASSDPDVGDRVSHRWEYVGATVDPAPNQRSPLSQAEIDELDGWILRKDADAEGGFTYIVNGQGLKVAGATTNGGDGATYENAGNNLKSWTSAYPYFDAPELTGFNNIRLTFKLTATDSADDSRFEVNGNLIDPATGEAYDTDGDDPESPVAPESDTDTVTVTVVNRFYSGNIPGPNFCTGRSLGGPQTFAFDSDKDGVADTCALNTTRRGTVARQNALETLATLNPSEFRSAVLGVCGGSGFKQTDYGDDPGDLDNDVCETNRVSPPPAAADPATAETYFSGTITGPDFCTNFSLGGARSYANDADGDGVADQCSLATTRREAVARQTALGGFIVAFTDDDQTEHDELVEWLGIFNTDAGDRTPAQTDRLGVLNGEYASTYDGEDGTAGELEAAETSAVQAKINALAAEKADAERWTNALAAACRALGTQDFGDAPSALARDACAPKQAETGVALS